MRRYWPLAVSTLLVCVGTILVASSLTYPDEQASLPVRTDAMPIMRFATHQGALSRTFTTRPDASPFVSVATPMVRLSNWHETTLKQWTIIDPAKPRYSGVGGIEP